MTWDYLRCGARDRQVVSLDGLTIDSHPGPGH